MNRGKRDHFHRSIDFDSEIPLKLQLRDILREKILNKELVDNDGKIETEFELMKRFNVSRVTVRSALQLLVDEGIIFRERGRGTFLRTNHPENWTGRLMGFSETIRESGMNPGSKILQKGLLEHVDEDINDHLDTKNVWELKRLRTVDGQPVAIEHAFYPTEFSKYLVDKELNSLPIYKFLEDEIGIFLHNAKQKISAVNATREEAELLEVEANAALLFIERTTYMTDKRPIEFLKAVYRPDYFQYLIKLSRKG